MNIAVTGHRPDAFLVSHYSVDSVIRIADNAVCVLKREFGEDLKFNLGAAIGVDQWVGMACIENNVNYHMYLPFHPAVQSKYWTSEQKIELDRQLKLASGINIVEPNINAEYAPYLYQERNEKMIDNADFVVAFWVGKKRGGTYHAINYGLKQSKFVFNALNDFRLICKDDLKTGWTPPTVDKNG